MELHAGVADTDAGAGLHQEAGEKGTGEEAFFRDRLKALSHGLSLVVAAGWS